MFVFWKIIFEPWFAFLEADKPYMITNCYFLLGHAFMDEDRHYCVHTGMFMCGKFFLALIGIFNANWHFFDWTDIFYVDRKNFLIVECPFWVCTRQWSLQSAEEASFEQIGFFEEREWVFICLDVHFCVGKGSFVLRQAILGRNRLFCIWAKPFDHSHPILCSDETIAQSFSLLSSNLSKFFQATCEFKDIIWRSRQ